MRAGGHLIDGQRREMIRDEAEAGVVGGLGLRRRVHVRKAWRREKRLSRGRGVGGSNQTNLRSGSPQRWQRWGGDWRSLYVQCDYWTM